MLDQHVICGVGNYLRADALYYAQIDPFKSTSELTDTELKELYDALRILMIYHYQLEYGLAHSIVTRDQINALGKFLPLNVPSSIRKYNHEFLVYGKKIAPCGKQIQTSITKPGSRTLYWVAA